MFVFQDFANNLYAFNMGDIYEHAPEDFYNEYFAGTFLDAYELTAI